MSSNAPPSAAPAAVKCTHCGLPVPVGLVEPGAAQQFCCNGCRTVYQVIHGCGLDRYYKLREAFDSRPQPARVTQRKYSEFDDEVFRNLYYRVLPDGSQVVELYLEGVHCAACVWLVEKLPSVLPGVLEVRLDMRRSMVEIRWDERQAHLSQIAALLDSLGYPPHPAKDLKSRNLRREEDRRFMIRMGVAAACAGNVMTLAFALYGGVFNGIEAQYSNFFRLASMAFGLVSLAWPGSLFFRGAWAALRTRTAHLDLPIAIGLAAGGIAGSVNAILGRGEIYFDSLTVLVLLLLTGRWLQRRQQCWANDALELLFSLTPTSARRREGENVVEVPIEAIRPGDLVEVRAGDSIPADGLVQEGSSAVNRALLTGESQAVSVEPGDPVHAGTVNLAARLLVRVEAVGATTRVGKLMRLVEEYSHNRPPVVQFADRVAGRFVVVVLTLAAATFLGWMWRSPAKAIDNAVSLLIVTCPCALGLATPLAMTIALGRAARRHILIKGGEVFEILSRRGTMLLDKTGTLTTGQPAVASWDGAGSVRPLVAALERHSNHPIAKALVAAGEATIPRDEGGMRGGQGGPSHFRSGENWDSPLVADNPHVADVRQTLGGGIAGTVDGRRILVGSPRFVRASGVGVPEELAAAEQAVIAAGRTPLLVAADGQCVAVVGLGEELRDDVPQALAALRDLGWHVRILSGDHADVVASLAARLGIPAADALGGVSPEEKLAVVRQAAAAGPVVMVGDGVNDSAALSTASVGIAVHGGAEASLAAAHVYLDRPGLMPIVALVHASRSTMRAIRRCLAASLAYNVLTGSLAIAGCISPLVAAILMPFSSFTVLALAYLVRTFGDRP